MASNYRHGGYADDGTTGATNGQTYQPGPAGSDERNSLSDTEKAAAVKPTSSADKNDPFGDESNSEVKYRTMHWWQAGMIMVFPVTH